LEILSCSFPIFPFYFPSSVFFLSCAIPFLCSPCFIFSHQITSGRWIGGEGCV
jgi:hypothetical protein